MGSWFSSQEEKITKTIDAAGQVNSNVIIEDTVRVHNSEIIYLLYVIAAAKILEFIMYVYSRHSKQMKRKYENNNQKNQGKV